MTMQRCTACGKAQYPPRELCSACLADAFEWHEADAGEVLAVTTLHHSHEPAFRPQLPLRIGLVRLEAGPTVVCFLADGCQLGTRVWITARADALLEATRADQPRAAAAAPSR
jgi:uncharacterized protein